MELNLIDVEFLIRSCVFKQTAQIVEYLLQQLADRADEQYQPPPGFKFKGRQTIQINSIFGPCELTRGYYYNEPRKQGLHPADAYLGLEASNTPALARLICNEGADETSFEKAQRHLDETGGIQVSARQIQRLIQQVGEDAQQFQTRNDPPETASEKVPILYVSADGTGVPMRKEEVAGRSGKQEDGGAKTRQAYLGCVFTQHRCNEQGHPERDHESTTYVSAFGTSSDFGITLRSEALRRGLGRAKETVLLIDGATGLEKMGRDSFPKCTQIVDYYHATEHANEVVTALLGSKDHPEHDKKFSHWKEGLLDDRVEELIKESRAECPPANREVLETKLTYFVNNVKRMQYGTFRAKGYFIGSGVIEAGCKTVIGQRCKQSGMFWSLDGAQKILALRSIQYSRYTDIFWQRRKQKKIVEIQRPAFKNAA